MWEASLAELSTDALAGRAKNALRAFLQLIDNLSRDCLLPRRPRESGDPATLPLLEQQALDPRFRGDDESVGADEGDTRADEPLPLAEQIEHAIARSGLRDFYEKDSRGSAESRVENLDELINVASRFSRTPEDLEVGLSELAAFLAHAALEAGEGQGESWEDCVQLMTLHSAKGLEFPLVFLVGLEDGLFPSQKSTEEPGRLEEERRLAYVGITRARTRLVLTYAESRRLHGQEMYARPSRFLREIPPELLHEVRPRVQVSRPVYASSERVVAAPVETTPPLKLGQRVRHATFGEGVVVDYEGSGAHTRVQINFERAGQKWLVLSYANLEMI